MCNLGWCYESGNGVEQSWEEAVHWYRRGAEEALRLCRLLGCEAALLKERSPSCGSGMVYDGTFTGVLTAGEGVTAELLRAQGIPVYGESRVAELADPI